MISQERMSGVVRKHLDTFFYFGNKGAISFNAFFVIFLKMWMTLNDHESSSFISASTEVNDFVFKRPDSTSFIILL